MDAALPKCYNFWEIYLWMCRVLGGLTAMVLWGVGIEAAYFGVHYGSFIIFSAVVVSFFELVFVVLFWVQVCVKEDESFCFRLWKSIAWVDDWRKAILYGLLSIGSFISSAHFPLGIFSGTMLVITAAVYSIKTLQSRCESAREPQYKAQTYDRFDTEVQEDIEEHVTQEVDPNDEIFGDAEPTDDQNVADQEEILDV